MRNSISAFVARLDDELVKSLQYMDHHMEGYLVRLADDKVLLSLLVRAVAFYDRLGMRDVGTQMSFRRLEHLFYTADSDPDAVVASDYPVVGEQGDRPSLAPSMLAEATRVRTGDVTALVQQLHARIFREGSVLHRVKASLYLVYHHALCDRYHVARDLLLMSGLHSVLEADIATQILYNRATVMLGLAAFRAGLVHDAHACLNEICSSGRTRELLGQGTGSKFGADRTPEQERAERRRQVPFHLHVNLETLELVHLASAMLLEVPNMAAHRYDSKRRVISKSFRRAYDISRRQIFPGSPDSVRETVVSAAIHLQEGDWQACNGRIMGLADAWARLHPQQARVAQVQALITERVKVAGLRTYLFTFSTTYGSIAATALAGMFGLPVKRVHAIVSKMAIQDELKGAFWDAEVGCVVLQSQDPTRLQHLALTLADKAGQLVEHNEKLFDHKTGGVHRDEINSNNHHHHGGHHGGGGRGRGGRGMCGATLFLFSFFFFLLFFF